jgi:hypothetical protein
LEHHLAADETLLIRPEQQYLVLEQKKIGDFEYKFGVKKALKPVETDALK